jgi:hypothetical protein
VNFRWWVGKLGDTRYFSPLRAGRGASAEQVRQPLYSSGVGYWRHFERQLEPLRQTLGDCLERFG